MLWLDAMADNCNMEFNQVSVYKFAGVMFQVFTTAHYYSANLILKLILFKLITLQDVRLPKI